MKYRKDKYGNEISVLGYGCMRFTRMGPKIDYDKAEKEIMAAFRAGVNYYDTAYIYPGSEALIGKIFASNGIRDKINIATKLPHYLLRTPDDLDRYFNEQLKRLQTDHVEYYLMHMLNDAKSWQRIVDLGAAQWLKKKKADGSIGQIGFSYHGNSEKFIELIDAYDWDFCQIQYNYYDEYSQAGRSGYEYAYSKGIPVVIMEPLRGGKLANKLPGEAAELFDRYSKEHHRHLLSSVGPGTRSAEHSGMDQDETVSDGPDLFGTDDTETISGVEGALRKTKLSPAQWGLRWLWDQPGIMCVLSGMNSLEMVRENCRTADTAGEANFLTEGELAVYRDVVQIINEKTKVPCTGCGYCMPCPANVDISGTFAAYNDRYVDGFFTAQKEYMMCTTLRKESTAASNCIGCGKCEEHCPQGIAIRDELKNARKVLEGPVFKIARKVAPLIYKY